MATVLYTAFLAIILVLQSHFATGAPPFSNPVLPPIFGDPCQGPVCGRGTCVPLNNSTIGFECECEPGWRQARPEEDVFAQFLPCVIPNCTLNFTCTDDPNPSDNYPGTYNISYSDPCSWAECGGGRCNATSQFTRTCECDEGYYNLLNSTVFPCYRRCAFGDDCPSLGFNTSTSIVDPNPFNLPRNHAASLIERAEFAGMITMATTFVGAVWKYI